MPSVPSIFDLLDEKRIFFRGVDILLPLKAAKGWRAYAFLVACFSLICWVFSGYDSTVEGTFPFLALRTEVTQGVGLHWSTISTYCFAFWLISRNLERQGVFKSRNLFLSAALVLGSIGVFELIYTRLYSLAHNQPWVFSFIYPQSKYIIRNIIATLAGILAILQLPRIERKALVWLIPTAFCWLFWYYYPFPFPKITVKLLNNSIWRNGPYFPQTLYMVSLTGEAFAEPFMAHDFGVHTVNILCKLLTIIPYVKIVGRGG